MYATLKSQGMDPPSQPPSTYSTHTYLTLCRRDGQGCKKLRSLRSGILDNSYLVRQIRLDPGEAPVLVRQIWPGRRPGYSCVCLIKTEMDNKHQITQDCIMSNFS